MPHPHAFQTIAYEHGAITLIDQRQLPAEEVYVEVKTVEEVAHAIEDMVVRGAPAIGITAAYGLAVAAHTGIDFEEADARLRRTRPTAVNLFWALDRMKRLWQQDPSTAAIEAEARAIDAEDAESCRRMGEIGAERIEDGARILTHCNAGALATAAYGTALAVIRAAHAQGKRIEVFADETRPWLQGARLTTWELMKDGIDVTLICDGAAAHLIGRGEISCAITGADRVASNGDVANKIGTRGVALAMKSEGLPFYVAAPWSTIDMSLASGSTIVIEERGDTEVVSFGGRRTAPEGVKVRNPAFDITPAAWVSNLFTERGETGADLEAGLKRLANAG